jgi:S-adenosylmethionine-diacylglycerol 3-amino-3-carboxypropyl transferase
MLAWTRQKLFNYVHSNNLVYNQCWEDPLLDHQALQFKKTDNVLMITSAGCNALDYLLKTPKKIHAVDMNYRQNALLELKISALQNLDYSDFFELFAKGSHPQIYKFYSQKLRAGLPAYAQTYWDKNISFFSGGGWRSTFYYHGTSGFIARLMSHYISFQGIQEWVHLAFQAKTLDEQRDIYFSYLKPAFWNDFLRWFSRRGATMSALGVPRSQFLQIEKKYQGGMAKFIEDCLESVFAHLRLNDNYFWHLYLFGSYSSQCCPNYLKESYFLHLKENVHRIQPHTSSLLDFLKNHQDSIHKVSLLDHMDWLYQKHASVLREQWQQLIEHSTSETKIIWRSASLGVDFVDPLPVKISNQWGYVGDFLKYEFQKAQELHKMDRVHTYGSFYVAQVAR